MHLNAHLIVFDDLYHALNLSFMCDMQAGLRPVCEFMTFNFAMQAIDQVLLSDVCFVSI